jgi:hypothetical protein
LHHFFLPLHHAARTGGMMLYDCEVPKTGGAAMQNDATYGEPLSGRHLGATLCDPVQKQHEEREKARLKPGL